MSQTLLSMAQLPQIFHHCEPRSFSLDIIAFSDINDQLSQASVISNYPLFPLRVWYSRVWKVVPSLPVVNILSLRDNTGNASKNSDSDGPCHWIIWVHYWINTLQELVHIQNLIQMFFTLLGDLKDAEPKKITPENKRTKASLVFWTVVCLLLIYQTSFFILMSKVYKTCAQNKKITVS